LEYFKKLFKDYDSSFGIINENINAEYWDKVEEMTDILENVKEGKEINTN
jgi:hypothetical protein